jgi:hypothetical protein
MDDTTIREQIITAILEHFQENWQLDNDYNYACGLNAYRAVKNINDDTLPAVVLWAGEEISEQTVYGQTINKMTVKLEAVAEITSGVNPSVIQEKLLGDIIKIMTNQSYIILSKIDRVAYTEGGIAEFSENQDTICGA